MSSSRYKVIDTAHVKKYIVDPTYSSRMLFDDMLAGRKTIQVNEGTVSPGCSLGGGVHGEDEIYYILRGEGSLKLDEETYDVKSGFLIYIPSGTFHALSNTNQTEPLVILTLWREPAENEVYNRRLKEWGTSFKMENEA